MELVLEATTEQFDSVKATALLQATVGISQSEASAAIVQVASGRGVTIWTHRCIADEVEQEFLACGVVVSLV